MGLNIVVCVKLTPAASNVSVGADGRVKTDGLAYGLNPFDEYAVEEALRIKDKNPGSTVTVLSVGPGKAEEAVRTALALGADEGALVADASFDGGDPGATAHLLSKAILKIAAAKGKVHLVLCGKQSSDSETGQVAPSLAAALDWPGVSSVKKIPAIDETKARVERAMEDGIDTLELDLPAVVSVIKEINEPRLPSLKGKMASKKAAVPKWGPAELQPEAAFVGAGAGTAFVKGSAPEPRSSGMRIEGKDAAEKAATLVKKLKELKFI